MTQRILQFCTSEYIVERLIDISVPQIQEHHAEVVKTIPRRRFQHHTEGQVIDVPVSEIREEIGEVNQLTPQERIDVPVSQIRRDIWKIIQLIPQERVFDRVTEQIIDAPVPQIRDPIVEVVKVISHERLQQCTAEGIVDTPRCPWRRSCIPSTSRDHASESSSSSSCDENG